MTRLTESSPTVTPYSASAASIVPRLWVMTMNWVASARLRSASEKRPTFASSSAASTSSRTQNGTGRTSSIANSRATAVSARSPPDSIDRDCAFLPGGRATISTPVAARSVGSVRSSRAKPPPKSCLKRTSKAVSSARNVVRNWSAISIASSSMSVRVRAIAARRSAPWVSSDVEPGLQVGVLLDRERVRRTELVEPPPQGCQPAGRRRLDRGRRGLPGREDERQDRLELGRLVVPVAGFPGRLGRPTTRGCAASMPAASTRPPAAARRARTPTWPMPASSTRTCSRIASSPSRASRSATSARPDPLVGRPEAFAGGRRGGLRGEEPSAIRRVRRAEIVEDGAGGRLARLGRRSLDGQPLALGQEPRLPFGQGPRFGLGAGDPAFGERRRGLRPGGARLGVPASGVRRRPAGPPAGRAGPAGPPPGPPRSRGPSGRPRARSRRSPWPRARPRPPARSTPPVPDRPRSPPVPRGRPPSPPRERHPPPPDRRHARPPPRHDGRPWPCDSSVRAVSKAALAVTAVVSAASASRSRSAASRSIRPSSAVSRSSSARRSSEPPPRPSEMEIGSATADPSRLTTTHPAGSTGWTSRTPARSGTQAARSRTRRAAPSGSRRMASPRMPPPRRAMSVAEHRLDVVPGATARRDGPGRSRRPASRARRRARRPPRGRPGTPGRPRRGPPRRPPGSSARPGAPRRSAARRPAGRPGRCRAPPPRPAAPRSPRRCLGARPSGHPPRSRPRPTPGSPRRPGRPRTWRPRAPRSRGVSASPASAAARTASA